MSNLQPNWCLKIDFQKVDQHAGGKWLIHATKRRKDNQLQSLKLPCRISKLSSKMWQKGVRWHHVESDILKEGPGTETSWEWGIVEHQIPSIKVLFKTNAKSHKHPGIKLLISESKTQLVNQRKQNHKEEHIYIYIYILTQGFWRGTKVTRRKHIIQPTGSIPVPRPVVNGMEKMCQRYGSDQTPTLLFEFKNHVSINSYSITYAVEEFLLSIIPNSVIVWSLQ